MHFSLSDFLPFADCHGIQFRDDRLGHWQYLEMLPCYDLVGGEVVVGRDAERGRGVIGLVTESLG